MSGFDIMSTEQKVEYFKSVQAGFDSIIKWSFGLNGAASAGLMTFLGNTVDKKSHFSDWSLFGQSMTFFIIGMIFSILCLALRVISLNFASQIHDSKSGGFKLPPEMYLSVSNRWVFCLFISILLLLAALSSFIVGTFYAKSALFV